MADYTKRLHRRDLLRGFAAAGLALSWPAGRAAAVPMGDARFFRIGTGSTSGTYFQLGGEIASAISNPPGSRQCDKGGSCGVPGVIAVAQATQGSVENVEAVAKGQLESALCQADVAAWAYAGTTLFDKSAAMPGLRSLANLYPETVHIVVRADSNIHSLKDLKGKRISLGEPESGTRIDAQLILTAAGLSEHDVKGSLTKLTAAADGLRAGTMDGFFQIAGYPVPAITDLASSVKIRLLPVPPETIDRLRKKYRFFSTDTIPAGTYDGVDGDVPTAGIGAQWIAAASLDTDFAYALVKALWHESTKRLLDNGHPIGKRIALARAIEGLGVPLHPGAERYYREAGLIPQAEPNTASPVHR